MSKLFITILFILFATSSSHLITRQIEKLQLCDSGKAYPVQLTKFTYAPDPIVLGQALSFNAAGTTNLQIEPNTILRIQGIVFVPVFTFNIDFCKEILEPNVLPGSQLCPIPIGGFSYQGSITIPNRPELKGLNGLRVRATLLSPDSTELTCLEGQIHIST